MGKVLFLLILVGLLASFAFWSRSSFGDPETLKLLVKDGAKLLDVRTEGEFASGHLDGAINIPVSDLGLRLAELGDPATPIVVYCRSGARSARAQTLLQSRGFASVHNLGGIGRWPKE